jgi:hypothetical protein
MSKGGTFEIQFQLRATPRLTQPAGRLGSGRLPEITRVLALAIYFDNMIRQGDAKDFADIGRLTCLCRERVSQIMKLNYLAPDIQIELLYLPRVPLGRSGMSEAALRRIANLLSWQEQRREWSLLKTAPDA